MLSRMAVVIAVIYRARSKAEAPARRGTRVDQIRYGRRWVPAVAQSAERRV
jgi:hypothetical protein